VKNSRNTQLTLSPLAQWIFLSCFSLMSSPILFASDVKDLRLTRTTTSLTGEHRRYQQYLDGLEVVGGGRIEDLEADGHQTTTESLAHLPLTRQLNALAAPVQGGTLQYLNSGGEARLAWRVITEERPLERFATYYDASTGLLLSRVPLFFTVQGRVFDPNPVSKLNDPSLRDANNSAAAVPDSAYTLVDLPDLGTSGTLSGPNVVITELEPPVTPAVDLSQSLLFDRSQTQFEDVNAYFHIDASQRYLQSLGYSGIRRLVAYPIPVDAHASNGTDNSYFVPTAVPGRGALYFGEGGTDDAEDSDILLHEFGHAIEEWIAPGAFSGTSGSQARALGEGFGDYWAFSSNDQKTLVSGRDPFCIGDWDARCADDDSAEHCGYVTGADCLRRVDGRKTMADYISNNSGNTEHLNGEIWSSALREIFTSLLSRYGPVEGKRLADTDVIEAHFGIPPNPTFASMAIRILTADHALNNSANAAVICGAMTLRGILTTADCDRSPKGDVTYFQSTDHDVAIPENNPVGIVSELVVADARAIQNLTVRLDVAHTARGDLRITLTAPDGTSAILQAPVADRTADIHATFGVDAQPAESLDVFRGKPGVGRWKLELVDTRPLDVGSLLSWSLGIQFVGDQPSAARPVTTAGRKHIAAVAHVAGANATNFATDLRLYNRGGSAAITTLIFTPTGADGTQTFSAVKLNVASGQIVQFDDVVAQLFSTSGTGQLEVLGDVTDLVITSRTYNHGGIGTYGQFIAAADTSEGSAEIVTIPQLRSTAAYRSNVGFAEVAGSTGVVEITVFDASTGSILSRTQQVVAPFSHAQFPAGQAGLLIVELRVVSGGARILAYGSMIDNTSGDAIYVPGQGRPLDGGSVVAPVISAAGALGTNWQSEVWLTGVGDRSSATMSATFVDARTEERVQAVIQGPGFHRSVRFDDIVPGLFARSNTSGLVRIDLPGDVLVTSRIFTGAFGQFVPFRDVDDPRVLVPGVASRSLLHIENTSRFRTNIGVANLGGLQARLRIHLFDDTGRELGSYDVSVEPLGLQQVSVSAIVNTPFSNGRASIELLQSSRGVLFYASTIDNLSSDPIYIPAQ
jgi:subtilisin-like proprotein convertase family protein